MTVGHSPVSPTRSARIIGAVFDSTMNFEKHISDICKSAFFHIRNIFQACKYLTTESNRTLVFMYKYHNQLLPSVFNSFFTKVDQVHSYNTRHASKLSYYLPKVRTNYGKFNIRFQGPMIWNSIDEDFKRSSLSLFKLKLKEHLTDNY